jgi:ATPase subunit of ABC transporter with duplicated ATPase domains
VQNLSGGERNRLQLAFTLKENGNLLLLDEPTNDLDVDTLRALEEAVLRFAGCAVVISHDRYFLDRVATHILAFEVILAHNLCKYNIFLSKTESKSAHAKNISFYAFHGTNFCFEQQGVT